MSVPQWTMVRFLSLWWLTASVHTIDVLDLFCLGGFFFLWFFFVSTLRYDGGRGGNGMKYRTKCQKEDPNGLVVIQNNWMVGNDRKVLRAKRWNHWFLKEGSEGNDVCYSNEMFRGEMLKKAIKSTESLIPPNGQATRAEKE